MAQDKTGMSAHLKPLCIALQYRAQLLQGRVSLLSRTLVPCMLPLLCDRDGVLRRRSLGLEESLRRRGGPQGEWLEVGSRAGLLLGLQQGRQVQANKQRGALHGWVPQDHIVHLHRCALHEAQLVGMYSEGPSGGGWLLDHIVRPRPTVCSVLCGEINWMTC